ncbi:MAG: amino acid adenylation domain-containing protein, partial [Acidobacteriota bacterium]
AERFGPNLFAKTPGERLYRTGDLARYRPSGSVEYLGRIDHQVKIHGYRIEIEEVEGALAAHPEVLETVVMAREDRVGERRLVAYFVAEPGASPTTSDLARFVGERLPPFMVPAVFQHLERLQLNPNGKVDRRNLPVPGRERPELAEAYEAPNGSREQVLAEVWCRVLGLDRVGRHDHFLELGGDSVSSLRIAVEARRRGLIFEVRELLEHPSIAELASLVREGEPEPAQAPADFGSEHSHPLSPMQAGILFHALQGDGSSYLEHVECALEEAVDVDALQRAWQRVVARHPALRTSFRWHEVIEPVQTVHAEVELPWSVCDLRGLAPEKQERLVAHHVRHAAGCQSFDLARPPLLRWMLWRLGEARWRLLVTYHHLIADGWSSAVVLEELETCYRAIVRGERPVLGDSLPFWEILEWRRRRDRPAATAFWRDILEGVTGPTRLGLERRRPKEGWSLTELRLSEPATEALRELARRRRWTLNTLLQGGFAILISRYAGEEEALFGNVVSGRPAELSGIDTAVGLFIDNVPLRTAASRGARLGPWLDELQRGQFAAAAHEHLGLAEIQRLSPLPRSQRLFDYFLVFASYPAGAGSWRRRDWPSLDTGYPLYLLVEPESRLRLRVVASAAVFAQVEVERFLGHLEVLLESLPVEPEVALGELPLLPPAERQQLLAEWNDTRIDWPEEPGFVQRFAAVAARYPDRVAVALGDEQRSYGRLAADAGRTARRLHERGLGRGTIVALLAERGPDFLTAVLGIVSVGGAYLPIDPSHPRRRQRQIIAASGAAMLLTRRTLWPEEDGVPGGVELGLAYLEELGLGDLDIPAVDEALESTAQPEDLAYVIYTSGSTGVPKGVMVEHRGMANHLDIKIFDLGIGETDVVLQNASQTFDVSVWQFLAALLVGGRVLVVADEVALDSARLLEAVETGSATVIEVVPSLLTYLLAEVDESQRRPSLRRLRWLVPTGEALSPELADRWLEHYPQIPLLNAYGPTECSDDVSHHRIDRPLPPDTVHVPVGRSLPNLQLYVLDRWLQPLPVGPPGELFVGGRGVGRGYLGQPRKTALTFLPDPFAAEGSRLYRTGDLACWLPDGSVEFRGRIDHQLKVRGFRIEPGEIEAALASHDDLRAAVVTALAAGSEAAASQGVRLVGYVVPAGDTAPSAAELRAWLGERLPAYMVPGELVVLDELPLLSSGKVDRRALPVPGTMVRSDEPTAPRTPLEELLVALWAEVLGLETVGIRADFFDLGGHSLAAVRLVARVSAAQGIELTLADLFDSPTVEALAALIEGRTAADKAVQVPPLEPVDRGLYPDGLPASFAQRRLWFLDQLEPGSAVYNVPFELRLAGRLEVSGLASALARIYRRHEVLRTVLREAGGEPRQWIAASEVAPLPIVDLSRLAQPAREGELARWSEREALRPFDLGRGPLARWTLLRLDEAEHALLVTFHHVVSDAESTPILVRELVELYAASVTGRPAELPALPIQYGDYAVWQRRWLAGEVLQAQIDHWKSELAGAPTVVELPFDRSRPPHPSYRGAAVVSRLDAELTGALNAVARRGETTLFMTLAAVYGALLERFTGQDDLLVGVPAAQRSRAELEDLIGFFINTLALRLELGGQPSWSEFLVRVRRRALAAYAHQELPFDRLVEDLRLERDSRRAPLVQALIQLIEVPPAKLEPSGLAITVFGAEKRVAKFDLTLNLRQSEDGLTATWLYATDLFDATTIRRLAEGWTRLIEALAEDPDSRVGAASLMRPAERHQLLAELGGAPARGPAAALLPARFAARAAQCPEAIAVVCGERQLSYGELARRAAGLARQLAAHGAGPEVLVGLCLERSERIAVAILGVLATGAAYLPLDPSYPRERLEFTLTDAAAKVVVTDPEHAERVAGDGRTVVVLGETACDPAALAPPELDAESAAYVIYTSGSTGRPKGVVITHAQVARLFGAALPWVDFGADEVWTLFHSYAFDFSVWELWGALLGGARLVVVPFDISRSPALFHDLLARERVSSLSQTPTAFQQLIAADGEPAADRLSLRRVYFGGEALEIGMLAPWFARHDDSSPQLVNLYGITETTVHASWRPLGLGDEPGGGSPIGGPLADLELHLLDHRGWLVPWGVAGEIHVSGGGVARGYHGRPGLTASRFVPHPWSEVAGARLYRSGDLARRRPSGELETLGRIDHQVKLRGFRIELGEIEAVLAAIPEVSAVTVGLDTSAGEPRLVAWTVTTASAAELKKAAAEVLPGYMVPAAIVLLEALPRTPEGKLDRRALPAPEALDREPAAGFVTPRDALEARLADLWGEVLGIERVGAEDNFFEFGGDSIRGAI